MRTWILILMTFTATLTVTAAPTALADCYDDAEQIDAGPAHVQVRESGCSYAYYGYASSWNSTDVRVEEDLTGSVHHVRSNEYGSSSDSGYYASSWDERRIYVYDGDNEWNAQRRVIVNVWDAEWMAGEECWGRTDVWVDVALRGVATVWQGQSVWNGEDPWYGASPLPCGWNDAVLA